MKGLSRHQIAWRAAQDLDEGLLVNLGIGLPSSVPAYVPADREVIYHSENGVLGLGPSPPPGEEDPDLIDASKLPITLLPGAAIIHHTDSFALVRGGHIDVALLGAFQVSVAGDIANWRTDAAGTPPGVGGAMDLAVGAREIRVLMNHVTRTGQPRLVERCTYPLTAAGVVRRVYTDLAVMDIEAAGFVVRELLPGLDAEGIRTVTAAPLRIAPDCRPLACPLLV